MRWLYRLLRRYWIALHPREPVLLRALRADDVTQWIESRYQEAARDWLARQDRGELIVLVAEVGGVPAGRRCLDFTLRADEGVVFCFAFTVRQQWQARGIGTLIERRSVAEAQTRDFRALRTAVAKHNTKGLAWHKRLGYRPIDEAIVRWLEPDGEHESDCWIMERRWGEDRGFVPRFISRWRDRLAVHRVRRRRLSRTHRGANAEA